MNRLFATLAVIAMVLLAIALSVRQMLETGQNFGATLLAALGLVLMVAGAVAVKRHFERYYGPTRSPFVIAQPLRRLLSAVWS
jgi:lipopolysaccharide export LptBFGC system permease protein LptF